MGVATVGGRRVNGDATVIAEALEAAVLPFLLPSTLMPGLVRLVVAASDDAVGFLPNFAGADEEADCLFQPEGVVFSPWHSQ